MLAHRKMFWFRQEGFDFSASLYSVDAISAHQTFSVPYSVVTVAPTRVASANQLYLAAVLRQPACLASLASGETNIEVLVLLTPPSFISEKLFYLVKGY